jgi:hypothetical protein
MSVTNAVSSEFLLGYGFNLGGKVSATQKRLESG